MIAIDTNVLLRYLLKDDVRQSIKARKLIKGSERVLVTDIVLVETIWALRGTKYQLKKSDLTPVIQSLFEEPNIRFENSQVVWLALNNYQDAKPVRGKEADFSDALIVAKARHLIREQHETFNGVFTFDKAAQVLPDTKAP